MPLTCNSMVTTCDLPIRLDNYRGCSHGCKYCSSAARLKSDKIHTFYTDIKQDNCIKTLKNFINGKRNQKLNWCDWDIPIRWGAMSDPFQPCELTYRSSYNILKLFAETNYPFIPLSKGILPATDEYLDIIKDCNCMLQFSLIDSSHDAFEPGAPTFQERLNAIEKICKYKRVVIKIQPYVLKLFDNIFAHLTKYANIGVYGITIDVIKYGKKHPNLVKKGSYYTFPTNKIRADYKYLQKESHRLGLKFYSQYADISDSLCCCGIDGMGWQCNTFNLRHIRSNDNNMFISKQMKVDKTAICFIGECQKTIGWEFIKNKSFYDIMNIYSSLL